MSLTTKQREMLEVASRNEDGVYYNPGVNPWYYSGGLKRTGESLVRKGLMKRRGYLFVLTSEGMRALLDPACAQKS